MLQVDGDLMATVKFADALKIPYIAPSFGGCESIVDQPAIICLTGKLPIVSFINLIATSEC